MSLPIQKGRQAKPVKAVLYGPPGVGKTTLAAGLPNPLFFDAEDGTAQLDVARVSITAAAGLRSALAELRQDRQGYATLVIDTGDWVETLITEEVLAAQKVRNIEDIGYGKGWVYLREAWTRFLADLDAIAAAGMHVVVLAHSITKKVAPPGTPAAYDTYVLKLNEQNGERLKEWSSLILFLNYDVRVEKGKDNRMRGVGGDERVLFTQPSAAWVAKNRFGLDPVLTADPAHLLPIFAGVGPAKTPPPPAAAGSRPLTPDQLARLQEARKLTWNIDLIQKALDHYKEAAIDLLTEEQAATVLRRIDEEAAKRNATEAAGRPPAYPWLGLLPWLEANETALNAFLVQSKWIDAGQTFRDLPPEKADKVKERPAALARAAGVPAPKEVAS